MNLTVEESAVLPIAVSTSPTANRRVDPAPILLTGSIDQIAQEAASAGAQAVELRLLEEDAAEVPLIKRTLSNAGLEVAGISTGRMARESGLCLSDTDPEGRRRAAESLRRLVDIAEQLGTDLLVGSAKGQQSQSEQVSDYCERLADGLRIADRHAADTPVRIHLEAINRFEINCLTTGAQTLEFIEKAELERCFVHLDTFHMNIEERDPAGAIRAMGDRLGYFQFADSNRLAPGQGHIDFHGLREALEQVGFRGYLSIECQPIPDGPTAARAGIEHLRGLFEGVSHLV